MRSKRRWVPAAVIGLTGSLLAVGSAPAQRTGITNKVEVREIDLGYELTDGRAKIRVILASGQALERVITDAAALETILRMTSLFSEGGGRMFAEVQGSTLEALDIEARRGGAYIGGGSKP